MKMGKEYTGAITSCIFYSFSFSIKTFNYNSQSNTERVFAGSTFTFKIQNLCLLDPRATLIYIRFNSLHNTLNQIFCHVYLDNFYCFGQHNALICPVRPVEFAMRNIEMLRKLCPVTPYVLRNINSKNWWHVVTQPSDCCAMSYL